MVMEVNLHAVSLCDAIEDEHATCKEDKQALAVMLPSTPSDMHCMLVGKGCAKEGWEAIRVQYQRSERVRESRIRRFQAKFETVAFKDGIWIDEFVMSISNVTAALCSLSDT
jgi:hypothetical protein